jgi:hypothetical protein
VSCLANPHPLRNYHGGNATESKRVAELRDPPEMRTHDGIVAAGIAERDHRGFKKDAPYKTTGVKELSPFRFLPYFDLVWDIMPDLMHIVPVMWKGHIFKMFRGKRTPSKVKALKKNSAEENAQLFRDHEEAKEHLKGWALSEVLVCVVMSTQKRATYVDMHVGVSR